MFRFIVVLALLVCAFAFQGTNVRSGNDNNCNSINSYIS